ncbi:hypothetical protein [uncultured Maritimibacter sp.]|jgi:hypothetical protein|uniref:hypothetical protein n=1 Tax=uncultured Maritimibacter sp. TaxID=991866 RepID=UPI00262703F1|nr:hypothetical protein [uncultured Maritimibacter sp.]
MMAEDPRTDVQRTISELKRCVLECEEIEEIVSKLLGMAPVNETHLIFTKLQKVDYLRQHLADVARFLEHCLVQDFDDERTREAPVFQLRDVQDRLLGKESETVGKSSGSSDVEWL